MPTAANSSHAGATCHITFPGTNNYFCSSCGYSSNGFWMALSSVSPQVLTCSTSFAKCEVFQTFSDIIAEMSTRCCVDCLWVALYQFLFRLLWWCVLNKHFFFLTRTNGKYSTLHMNGTKFLCILEYRPVFHEDDDKAVHIICGASN